MFVFASALLVTVCAAARPAAPADGAVLEAAAARITGGAQFYDLNGHRFIGAWRDPKAAIEWTLTVLEEGRPEVVLTYSCAPGNGGDFQLAIGGEKLRGKVESTGDWYAFKEMKLGTVSLAKGTHKVRLTAGPFKGAAMNVERITLAPLKAAPPPPEPPPEPPLALPKAVYVVPNFHPASCGWLANWSVERSYCANSYLDHLDRVRDDPAYAFAISECNNMIAILNFYPERFEELKKRIKEGRVEAVNAFFLESTINLSGGEALVKMGVEGLRWQQQVLGVRPRILWAIDVCGTHEQMAQITAGLELDALVFSRHNPTPSPIFWAESPDGTRALVLSPGHYSDWRAVFGATAPLPAAQLKALAKDLANRASPTPLTDAEMKKLLSEQWAGTPRRAPFGLPVLILGGKGDYALAPLCKTYPTEFIKQFREIAPQTEVKFSTPSKYLDAVMPKVKSGEVQLPTMRGGTRFSFDSFWIQCPGVKLRYRSGEQALQCAEMLSTVASLKSGYEYPVQDFYHAWLLMCLNMDRNTLWGAAGGMVFEDAKSWDAQDRFDWVSRESSRIIGSATSALAGRGTEHLLFNPLNWHRTDPFPTWSEVSNDLGLQEMPKTKFYTTPVDLPPMAIAAAKKGDPVEPKQIGLPESIETTHYSARVDPATGALVSLKIKPSGREMLGGPANVLVAERTKKQQGDPGDQTAPREGRERLGTSNESKPAIRVQSDPLCTTVMVLGDFYGGGRSCRVMRFYKDYSRIDFHTLIKDIPDRTVVVAEFPLAEEITEVRRGIPYGFSHGAWSKPNPELHGWTKGITPAVRWSHYTLAGGGGAAILDMGLPGRELTEKTPIIFLLNATEKYYGYPNSWLSGKGTHQLHYALVAHDGEWRKARIPQMAWEYNCPPDYMPEATAVAPQSFLQTSDNVIVEALRREGPDIELRMAECFGYAGEAEVTLNLPHTDARLTDLVGGNPKPLSGGPTYKFPIRPQQIVTMRFRAPSAVPDVKPLTKWDELVPPEKREALNTRIDAKGHPPRGK
jgi:alpha-mannosidase